MIMDSWMMEYSYIVILYSSGNKLIRVGSW